MEIIIQILILFVIFNSILKLSFWKWWQAIILGLICAAFIIWAQQYAIMQSKTQIQDYLSNQRVVQNMAVIITLESIIYFAFCITTLAANKMDRIKKRLLRLLFWYPGLLLFPVLFYLLTQFDFLLSGISFDTTAYIFAGIIFMVISVAPFAARLLEPEKELRLEIHFLISLIITALGLLITVNGNVTYAAVKEPLNIRAICFSVGVFVVFSTIGYFVDKNKWKLKKRVGGKIFI